MARLATMIRRVARGAFALALLGPAADLPLRAQEPTDASVRVDPAVPVGEGVSTYGIGNQQALVFLIRPAIKIRSWETHSWGLRLRLGFRFSILKFDRLEDLDLESVRLGSFVPGLEGVFPLAPRSLLRPYFDFGLGKDLDGDDPAWVTGLGIWSEFVFPWKRFELGLEPRLDYVAVFTESDLDNDDYGAVVLQADARHPLWFKIGQSQPDAGIYVKYSYLRQNLNFEAPGGGSLDVRNLVEVGAIFGFQVRPKLLFFKVPTVGIGYRFGDLRGITIRIGEDRIVRLATPLR